MSKKLIAVAAAAALALTGLVAAPAGASAITNVTVYHSGSAQGTALTAGHTDSDSAIQANTFAAARNVVFSSSYTDAATRTAVRFDVNTAAAASAINITATGGVRVIATIPSSTNLKVTDGVQALNGSTVAGALTYTFYAWNTSSTAGTVVVDTGASKMTFYVKGRVGAVYNIATPVWPTSLPQSSTTGKVTFTVTDAYGNAISSAGAEVGVTALGATAAAPTYSSTSKTWSSTLTVDATSTSVALQIKAEATDQTANGFAAPANVAFTTIASGSLSTQVTALTAQVAALTATIAGLTTEFNSVAKKYNKLVKKSKRVVLK